MGFDDIDMLKYVNPRLCTVRYPSREIAVTAVNCLVDQINQSQNKHLNVLLLQHQVVDGESL
jgi:LacI family transcriptional regulator